VSSGVDNGPEEHLIGDLTVEPNIFIGREQPSQPWADDADDIAEHWDQNETTIKGQNQTCTTG
jgi:hypothetical protein